MTTRLADQAHDLLNRQKQDWDLLREGYESLAHAHTRSFEFDGFVVNLQFNPGRIISSSAQVDEQSIRARPCFLCRQNRPPEQKELPLHDDLVLLCNPFPIFPEHFTVPTISHTPQRIADHFGLLLDLARDFAGRCTVFYNGPGCGASAPDHLHFQAGTRNFMPIDWEYPSLRKAILLDRTDVRVYAIDSYLRHFLAVESDHPQRLISALSKIYTSLQAVAASGDDEPMMNILATFDGGEWRVIIFPRARHRPSFYLAEGDEKILLSPAAVDLGGLCITPLEGDFQRLTKQHLVQMFEEVTLPSAQFSELCEQVRRMPT